MNRIAFAALAAMTAVSAFASTASASEAGKCGKYRFYNSDVGACLDSRIDPGKRAVVVEEERPVVIIDNGVATVVRPVEVTRY